MKTRRFHIIFLCAWLATAIGWAFCGNRIAGFVSRSFETVLQRLGASKVPDTATFVVNRVWEALWLLVLTWLVWLLVLVVWHQLRRLQKSRLLQVIAGSFFGFILLNFWCWGAGQTAFFWLILRGPSPVNQAQFRAKEILLSEIKMKPVITLVGNSQARSQIIEEDFNRYLHGKGWLMEMHFPGSRAIDVWLTCRRFSPSKVDGFVFYVSPMTFYSKGTEPVVLRDLLRFRDILELSASGSWRHFSPMTLRYGLLSALCPVFQDRSSLQHLLFGPSESNFGVSHVATDSREVNVANMAKKQADGMTIHSTSTEYQKAMFIRFLDETKAKGQFLILIGGQCNPVFEATLTPDVRPDYEAFLKQCAVKYSNVTLVWQNDILVQKSEDYVDSTHATQEAASRFSKAFAAWYLRTCSGE